MICIAGAWVGYFSPLSTKSSTGSSASTITVLCNLIRAWATNYVSVFYADYLLCGLFAWRSSKFWIWDEVRVTYSLRTPRPFSRRVSWVIDPMSQNWHLVSAWLCCPIFWLLLTSAQWIALQPADFWPFPTPYHFQLHLRQLEISIALERSLSFSYLASRWHLRAR